MDGIVALAAFAFVSSVTPGPNNLLLWASGAEFGIARTLPHVAGTALGLGAMALAVGAGLGALITSLPALAIALKILGSAYLVWLAMQISGVRRLARAELARPLRIRQAAAFQLINPKAWVFALGAVTTFRPATMTGVAGSLAVAGTIILVIVPTALIWAVAGGALNRWLGDGTRRRAVGVVLAVLVIASVVSVWV
jgi:threonine/homoserine/homoserine lactone efflux protein